MTAPFLLLRCYFSMGSCSHPRLSFPAARCILSGVSQDPSVCPNYIAAMEILAKPWNGMLIAALERGPLRFSELAAHVPQIADRMLAARLKELEGRGVLRRTVDHGPPVRVSYALTEVGRRFREVSDALSRWGRLLMAAEGAAARSAATSVSKRGRRGRARDESVL